MTITTNTNSTIKQLLGNVLLVEWKVPAHIGRITLPDGCMATVEKVGIPAKVLMVGSKFEFSTEVKQGSTVLVSKYLGTILDKTKEHIRVYDAEDILGIIE